MNELCSILKILQLAIPIAAPEFICRSICYMQAPSSGQFQKGPSSCIQTATLKKLKIENGSGDKLGLGDIAKSIM